MSQGNTRLPARLLSPAQARFKVMDAQPLPTSPHPDKQAKNDGVRKRAIHSNGVTDVRAAVLFVPLRECETPPKGDPKVIALNQW